MPHEYIMALMLMLPMTFFAHPPLLQFMGGGGWLPLLRVPERTDLEAPAPDATASLLLLRPPVGPRRLHACRGRGLGVGVGGCR